MLNVKDIRLLTPEERAEAAARRRDEETQVYQKRLASLDEWPLDRQCGRSRLVLPPEVAQRVLDDVGAGASLRAIEDKYRAAAAAGGCGCCWECAAGSRVPGSGVRVRRLAKR